MRYDYRQLIDGRMIIKDVDTNKEYMETRAPQVPLELSFVCRYGEDFIFSSGRAGFWLIKTNPVTLEAKRFPVEFLQKIKGLKDKIEEDITPRNFQVDTLSKMIYGKNFRYLLEGKEWYISKGDKKLPLTFVHNSVRFIRQLDSIFETSANTQACVWLIDAGEFEEASATSAYGDLDVIQGATT